MADKYVGNGWAKSFANGGSVINVSVKLSELQALDTDAYGNVRLVVGERKSPDEKSKSTHWVKVDSYFYDHKKEKDGPGF